MNIDRKASLVAKQEVVINPSLDQVWKIQTNIDDWPQWQKQVSFATLQGNLATGTVFKWKVGGINITSVLREVNKNKSIGWSGRSIGTSVVHLWRFEKQGNKTKVITEESMSGWFPRLIKIFNPKFLDQTLLKSLTALKTQAEIQSDLT